MRIVLTAGRVVALGALAALIASLTGCESHPRRAYDAQALRYESFTANDPAVVLASPGHIADRLASGEIEQVPWWVSRHDDRLNVRGGEPRGEVIDYAVYVDDRQRSFGDRQHDIHRRSAQSAVYGRIVR